MREIGYSGDQCSGYEKINLSIAAQAFRLRNERVADIGEAVIDGFGWNLMSPFLNFLVAATFSNSFTGVSDKLSYDSKRSRSQIEVSQVPLLIYMKVASIPYMQIT